jgi:hypothetical protein
MIVGRGGYAGFGCDDNWEAKTAAKMGRKRAQNAATKEKIGRYLKFTVSTHSTVSSTSLSFGYSISVLPNVPAACNFNMGCPLRPREAFGGFPVMVSFSQDESSSESASRSQEDCCRG